MSSLLQEPHMFSDRLCLPRLSPWCQPTGAAPKLPNERMASGTSAHKPAGEGAHSLQDNLFP